MPNICPCCALCSLSVYTCMYVCIFVRQEKASEDPERHGQDSPAVVMATAQSPSRPSH